MGKQWDPMGKHVPYPLVALVLRHCYIAPPPIDFGSLINTIGSEDSVKPCGE